MSANAAETSEAIQARRARAAIRRGQHTGPTGGLAPGCAQANLVVLPQADAAEFLRFCVQNPKPCPLLDITEAGSPFPTAMAADADLRIDVPRYRVFRDGRLVDEPTDINAWWRSDLVTFLLGCSFTFDWALASAGLVSVHLAQRGNVPMFVTNRECVPTGRFAGPVVVTMRPFTVQDATRAAAITSRFPAMHGAPIHNGDPEELGITDLEHPDFGAAVRIAPNEVPVFWACGVTPQVVIGRAALPLAIFHAPGHMFITDRPHTDFDVGTDKGERSHDPT